MFPVDVFFLGGVPYRAFLLDPLLQANKVLFRDYTHLQGFLP